MSSSAIIDNLQRTFTSPDVAIVFIFGHDEAEEEPTSTNFLEKILAQLVYRKRMPSHATAALYNSESFEQGRASAKAFQDAIRAEVNCFSRAIFIVDGVDTQADKDRLLNRLQKLPDHAQLLVTMREDRYASKDDHLAVPAGKSDLELYVGSRIEQDDGLTSLLKQYPLELRKAIVQQVAQKSNGLYENSPSFNEMIAVSLDLCAVLTLYFLFLGFFWRDCIRTCFLDVLMDIYSNAHCSTSLRLCTMHTARL